MANGRILIVEHDAIVAWDFSELLALAGYEVCCAGSSGEALRKACTFRPELSILDADATGPVGAADTAERLQEEHGSALVYLTSLPGSKRSDWLTAASPLAFLGKPLDPSELLTTAAAVIAMHRARGQSSLPLAPPKLGAGCLCSPARGTSLVPLTQ